VVGVPSVSGDLAAHRQNTGADRAARTVAFQHPVISPGRAHISLRLLKGRHELSLIFAFALDRFGSLGADFRVAVEPVVVPNPDLRVDPTGPACGDQQGS
jgi:hypothetical protein